MDIMKLNDKPVLHIVDKGTKFGAAHFLPGESTDDVWNAYMAMWFTPYVGHPDVITCDQGSVFTSHKWDNLLRTADISKQISGVEHHNALGVGERYHAYLRRVYDKVRLEDPSLDRELSLAIANKAVNDTAGPRGLVPTLLVFGISPRLPISPKELPGQIQRMKAMKAARREMSRITAQARITMALTRNAPKGTDSNIAIGDEILWYRDKPIGRWTGPHLVMDKRDKLLEINDGDRQHTVSIDRVKRYHEHVPSPEFKKNNNDGNGNDHGHANNNNPRQRQNDRINDAVIELENIMNDISNKNLSEERRSGPETMKRLDEILGTDTAVDTTNAIPVEQFSVKVLKNTDDRIKDADFVKAKQKEIDGLQRRNIWDVIDANVLGKNANILGGRFVYTLKNYGTPNEAAKARYVAQGFGDKDKPYIVHDTATLRASSVRIVLSTAATHDFKLFSHDVNQAYLQSKYKLTREVYIRPKKEDLHLFDLNDGQVLKLKMPLYGVCDAGDYWGVTMDEHLINDIGMTPTPGDPALYVKIINENGRTNVVGITGSYVDDSINGGKGRFQDMTMNTLRKFESKPRIYDTFDFFGMQIETRADGILCMNQKYYANNLTTIPNDVSFPEFRRTRALFSWMLHSRPDMACYANRAAQVTEKTYGPDKIRELNTGIRKVKETPMKGLSYGPMKNDELHLRVYADASFSTNDDLSSQLGFITLLSDNEGQCHILDYSSKKSKRVVRSIMGGEVCAFMDAFDSVFTLAADLELIYARKLHIYMFTDSKQLFDAMIKGKRTQEKRLMVDITAARQSYKRFEIHRVGLVRGTDNPADGLSKIKDNGALDRLLD